ncbi:unnamed protein product [Arctogadus glacialis]
MTNSWGRQQCFPSLFVYIAASPAVSPGPGKTRACGFRKMKKQRLFPMSEEDPSVLYHQ